MTAPTNHEAARGYVFDLESNRRPVAVVSPVEQEAVAGSVIKLDARSSWDPDPGTTLSYDWQFAQVPIGSQVEEAGFLDLESDGSVVSFAPDVVGHYQIQLVVNDGSLDSTPVFCEIDTRIIMVPNHKGLIPDASWIWNYLSDFWRKVEGRRRFDVFWSAAIQAISSELLNLYQYDYNKSIRDIQRLCQRRWLHYDPYIDLSTADISFILADDQAGISAATALVDPQTGVIAKNQPDYSTMVSVPAAEGSFQSAAYGAPIANGRILTVGGRAYTMARSGTILRARVSGTDGTTVARSGDPPAAFHGSGFRADMVGQTLQVLAGLPVQGVRISEFKDSTTLVLATALPIASNLSYAVLPLQGDSAFFADRDNVVPTRQINRPWRFSSTLTAAGLDFEALGVSPGDALQVKITRTDNNRSATITVQVTAVDRHGLGFIIPLDVPVDGEAAGGFDVATQLTLADALQVPSIIQSAETGGLYYTDQAAALSTLLHSPKFKRKYYERRLKATDEIDLGVFSVTLQPVRIVRNRTIPLADQIVSVPVLQEYIKQPDTLERDGQLFQVVDSTLHLLARRPKVLVENLDYVIDDTSGISGTCTIKEGESTIKIPYGDLIDRSVKEGDRLRLTIGPKPLIFDILAIVDAETVRVQPTPTDTAAGINFVLERKITGRFVRFVQGIYTARQPAPERLWAEVTYLDNSDAIEGNFGVLVGLTAEQLKAQESQADYLSSVAGLMYSLTTGPTINSLELAGQILLGLPFTEQAGVIIEIDPAYRKTFSGAPLSGRVLVEGRDEKNLPTGLTNIYFYPHGSQEETSPEVWAPINPEMSGLAINPDTGKEYQVGDAVGQFVKLSKGVEVQTYLNQPSWYQQLVEQGVISATIEKYHTFRFLANADLVRPEDMDLAAQFLRETKSSHVRLLASLMQLQQDRLDINDELMFAFGTPPVFFDTLAFGLPMATKFDPDMASEVFLSFDGNLYTVYLRDNHLSTTQDSNVVTSPFGAESSGDPYGGGFINARALMGEVHDSPFLRAGDVLEITEGSNAGRYSVSSVPSDTTIALDLSDGRVLVTGLDQPFVVYRRLDNPLFTVQVTIQHGEDSVILPSGGFSAAIAVDDLLVFSDDTKTWVSQLYTIKSFDPGTHQIELTAPFTEASGTYHGYIIREGLLKRYLLASAAALPHMVDIVGGDPWINFVGTYSDPLQIGLLRPGDRIERTDDDYYQVVAIDRANLRVYVNPVPTTSRSHAQVRLVRPPSPTTLISTDILDRFPLDHLFLGLVPTTGDLTTTAASAVVSTVSGVVFNESNDGPWIEDAWPTPPPPLVPPDPPLRDYTGWPLPGHIASGGLNVEPGDVLEIMSGADQGEHVIGDVGATTLTLVDPLTATHGTPGIPYKLWRRRPDDQR